MNNDLELVEFKKGVMRDGVHPLMFFWLGVVAAFHLQHTGRRLRVTSIRRRYVAGVRSKHSPKPPTLSTAADIGRRALGDAAEDFCRMLQATFGRHLGVVLEPEWLTVKQLEKRFGLKIRTPSQERAARLRVGPHVHLQLKGRLWSPAERS